MKQYRAKAALEEYQLNRILSKPETTKLTVAMYLGLLIAILFGFSWLLFVLSPLQVWAKALLLILFLICLAETCGRLVGIKIVECYQHYAPEETRRRCKCVPSCSEYAILCLKKYELVYALRKIRKRLYITCKGFDYIIDEP